MKAVVRLPASRLSLMLACCAAAAVGGCGSGGNAVQQNADDTDPAVAAALATPIMVDPQMSGDQGAALSAVSGAIAIPPDLDTPDAAAAALQDAIALAGGPLSKAPVSTSGTPQVISDGESTAAQVARRFGLVDAGCLKRIGYSATWAAKLPADLSVYPRGAVQEAAGTDAPGCALRVVNFRTPVGAGDVMDFYYTMARRAGWSATYRVDGADNVLRGGKGGRAYVVHSRRTADGVTDVDLIVSGKGA